MGTLVMVWLLLQTDPTLTPAQTPWPCTIAVGINGPPVVPIVWKHSSIFRRQCKRLADAKIVVAVEWADDLTSFRRAETRIVLNEGLVRGAVVRLRASDEPAVHLLHELEHVMEALDGVDHRSSKRSWQTVSGGYETARARRIEDWARRELGPLAQPSAGVGHGRR